MEGSMGQWRWWLAVVLFSTATVLSAQAGTDPRETSYQFFVDGTLTAGVIGFQIEFNHDPQSRSDARQLNAAYSPDLRRFAVTVTQKGLNRLQDWINSATSSGNPVTKTVSIVARDSQQNVLARWELTGVTPATVSSTLSGAVSEVDATIQFAYDTLTLVQASPN
jgi:hypothetical protein